MSYGFRLDIKDIGGLESIQAQSNVGRKCRRANLKECSKKGRRQRPKTAPARAMQAANENIVRTVERY